MIDPTSLSLFPITSPPLISHTFLYFPYLFLLISCTFVSYSSLFPLISRTSSPLIFPTSTSLVSPNPLSSFPITYTTFPFLTSPTHPPHISSHSPSLIPSTCLPFSFPLRPFLKFPSTSSSLICTHFSYFTSPNFPSDSVHSLHSLPRLHLPSFPLIPIPHFPPLTLLSPSSLLLLILHTFPITSPTFSHLFSPDLPCLLSTNFPSLPHSFLPLSFPLRPLL